MDMCVCVCVRVRMCVPVRVHVCVHGAAKASKLLNGTHWI